MRNARMFHKRHVLIIATIVLAATGTCEADSLIATLTNSAWGNTGVQSNPPTSFIVSLGDPALYYWLKILANSGSYGLFVELNPNESDTRKTL